MRSPGSSGKAPSQPAATISAQLRELSKTFSLEAEKLSTPDPVKWIEKNFFIPETRNDPLLRGRLKLMPYQRDVVREALGQDAAGNYKYSIIVWSDIKKSIKST